MILAATVIASILVGALASSEPTYTWERTFEVGTPEIACEIEIGDCRLVGCPAKVWVLLKLEDGWKDCREERKYECDEHGNNKCNEECEKWENDHEDDCMDCCHVEGRYSAHLYWWNHTVEDWQNVMHLQEDTAISLTCRRHVMTYMFTPEFEGEYKVVVHFTIDSETLTFTTED